MPAASGETTTRRHDVRIELEYVGVDLIDGAGAVRGENVRAQRAGAGGDGRGSPRRLPRRRRRWGWRSRRHAVELAGARPGGARDRRTGSATGTRRRAPRTTAASTDPQCLSAGSPGGRRREWTRTHDELKGEPADQPCTTCCGATRPKSTSRRRGRAVEALPTPAAAAACACRRTSCFGFDAATRRLGWRNSRSTTRTSMRAAETHASADQASGRGGQASPVTQTRIERSWRSWRR